ncbi:MAG: diheme cytochrome c [Oricola sp.]
MTRFPYAPRLAALSLAIATALSGSPAFADDDEGENFGAVTDPVVKQECSACHMAFSPAMLPAKSWEAITGNLADHYGDNASLDAATTAAVRDWLVANASQPNRWMVNAADGGDTPMRITETAWWVSVHDHEVRPSRFTDPKVGSKANCTACHRGAEQGYFEDD